MEAATVIAGVVLVGLAVVKLCLAFETKDTIDDTASDVAMLRQELDRLSIHLGLKPKDGDE
jgi:hypothetical protein